MKAEIILNQVDKGNLKLGFHVKTGGGGELYIRHKSNENLTNGQVHLKCRLWDSEFMCQVEPLYFSDENSTTVEK